MRVFFSFILQLKVNDDRIKIDVHVPKEHIGLVVGKGRKNIEKIETKSGTKIKVPSLRNAEGRLECQFVPARKCPVYLLHSILIS
jgi:predicted PilT family ATPase